MTKKMSRRNLIICMPLNYLKCNFPASSPARPSFGQSVIISKSGSQVPLPCFYRRTPFYIQDHIFPLTKPDPKSVRQVTPAGKKGRKVGKKGRGKEGREKGSERMLHASPNYFPSFQTDGDDF